jgi:hypothetical protein
MRRDIRVSKGMSHKPVLRHIGNVLVSGGHLLILDPKSEDWELGVASPTAEGHGVYPVFQVYEGGHFEGLYVDFMSEPPDRDFWPGEVPAGNVVLINRTGLEGTEGTIDPVCTGCGKPFSGTMMIRDPAIGPPRCPNCVTESMANFAVRASKQYYDLQRHWTRRIVPHLKDEQLNAILIRDFNKFTMGRWKEPFLPDSLPEDFESCDWRWSHGRRGPCPRYWSYVKFSTSHWITNFALKLAQLAEPNQPWRIVGSELHSTVWDGQNTLFEFNLQALGVPAHMAWELAAEREHSEELPIGQEMELALAKHFSIPDGEEPC